METTVPQMSGSAALVVGMDREAERKLVPGWDLGPGHPWARDPVVLAPQRWPAPRCLLCGFRAVEGPSLS